ncbi:class I SAM-dependent methyltransferase [Peterkaempfera sp. SMS 1(5)a]|uniref:class I SAM-dependent methyltransferase n=1 Tax=Peterkaempfera podocarpi TaxID=3232308 RepID=UPI0036729357
MSEASAAFGREFWEERYRGHPAGHSPQPSPQLLAETGELTPGRALDAGCGEGANALWLASHGWQVTAVDIAAAALGRAREHAEQADADAAGRIDWVRADLTAWAPAEEHFDLVTAHYVHPAAAGDALLHRLAASVAPGGTLLVVGHHPSEEHSAESHGRPPEAHVTAEEAAASLDPGRWEIVVAEVRSRPAAGPHPHGDGHGHGHGRSHGHGMTLRDAVLRARRRI